MMMKSQMVGYPMANSDRQRTPFLGVSDQNDRGSVPEKPHRSFER